jgi:hypothetical protein
MTWSPIVASAFLLAKLAVWFLDASCQGRGIEAAMRQRTDRTSTNGLMHLSVRTQIRTAQPGSIRATRLGTIAAAYGLSSLAKDAIQALFDPTLEKSQKGICNNFGILSMCLLTIASLRHAERRETI